MRVKPVLLIASAALVVLLALALRVLALDADQPPSMSTDFVSDEAWWAHNARNQALFGRWILDDFNQGIFAAPLHTVMVRLSFGLGGVSLKQARLVSALSGLGTICLVGLSLWRGMGPWSSIAGMAILAFDYPMVTYDRSGFVEPLPVLLMTLAAALTLAPSERLINLFAAGVVAVLAMFAKANSVFFLPVPFLFLIVRQFSPRTGRENWRGRNLVRKLAAYSLGVSLCFAIWLFAFIRPNWDDYTMQNNRLRYESHVSGIPGFFNLFSIGLVRTEHGFQSSEFLTADSLPLALAFVWVVHNGIMIWRRGLAGFVARLSELERFALVWLLMFIPYFVSNRNDADRRYYMFLIPLIILGVHVLAPRRRELVRLKARPGSRTLASLIAGLVLCSMPPMFYFRAPLINVLRGLTRHIPIGHSLGLSVQTLAAIASAIVLTGFLLIAPLLVRTFRGIRFRVGLLAAVAVGILLPIQLYSLSRDACRLSFTVADATERLRSWLGDDARMVNGSGMIVGTHARNLILIDRRWVGSEYPLFGRALVPSYRPTHLSFPYECGEKEFAALTLQLLGGWGRYVPGTLHLFPFCRDDRGGTRFVCTIGQIEPVKAQ